MGGAAMAATQPSPMPSAASAPVVASPAPTASAPTGIVVPALTPVKLEIRKQLVSKVDKPGAFFPLRLAEPILVGGAVAVPAGAEGQGEVVESKGGSVGGSAGILILAARFVTVDGRPLRLRSMHIAQTGTDNRAAVDTAMLALGFIGMPGFFITGGKTTVPAGTVADAKTAEAFTIAAPTPALASSIAPPASMTGGAAIPPIAASAARPTIPERNAQ
jgi:hypothetical protein